MSLVAIRCWTLPSNGGSGFSDDYFVSRKLYPNVDFYSGLIYQALGFPMEMFTVLFAIPRTVGWLAHMSELQGQRTKDQPSPTVVHRPRRLRLHAYRHWLNADINKILPMLALASYTCALGDLTE